MLGTDPASMSLAAYVSAGQASARPATPAITLANNRVDRRLVEGELLTTSAVAERRMSGSEARTS
jgi:hypothetical protein